MTENGMGTKYHCCATCVHYKALRTESGVKTFCSRLGYDTKPSYQFYCWTPKDRIRAKLGKDVSTDDKTR